MSLYLVLLPFVAAFSLANTEQCVSSAGSSIDLSLHSLKNASGHWIIKVDTRRFTLKENPRELTVNVHQESRSCDSNEFEQLFSVNFVYPSLHDTSMPGAIEPSTTSTTTSTTTTSTAPSTTTTSTAPSTTTTSTAPSTTTTSTPPTTTKTTTSTTRSCPHSGYKLFPEFNCYKAFPSEGEIKTWSEAREQCRRDGGDLMVMETEREREQVYIALYNSASWYDVPWVGVHIPDGEDGWMTVKGEPAPSTWWGSGYPTKYAARKCALADSTGLLVNYECAFRDTFICEIPL